MRARFFLVAALLLTLLGHMRVAAAADDEATRTRTRVVSSLDELSPSEQALLLQLGSAATRLTRERLRDCADGQSCSLDALLIQDWRKVLESVAKKLGTQGGWKAGLLAQLVPRGVFEDRLGRDIAANLVTSQKECASLKPPELESLESLPAACRDKAKIDPEVLLSHELLRVLAVGATRIDVISVGATTRIETVEDADDFAKHHLGNGKHAFVIPRDSAITLRVFFNRGRVPVVRTFGSTELAVEVVARNRTCLLFDLRPTIDPNRIVLVNGQDLGNASSVEVPDERLGDREPPAVLILDPSSKKKGQYRRLESRSIPWSELLPGRCHTIQLDLTHRGGLAVIGANALPGCMAQGVTSTKLRTSAEAILEDMGEKPRKMTEWSDTLKHFGKTFGPLQTGRRLGASVGRLDSSEALLTNAGEFARQGFSALISLELSCRGNSPDTAEYTLHATRLDVVKLAEPVDPVSARDVDDDLRPVSESVHGERELEGLMVRVLSRLQGQPYIWTQPDLRLRRLQGSASERVSVYLPPDHTTQAKVKVSLEAHRLSPQEEYICRAPDGAARLSEQSVAKSFWNGRSTTRAHHEEWLSVSPGTESTSTVYWNPYGSGLYVLRLQAGIGGKEKPTTFRCVEVRNQYTYLWFDLSYQRGLGPTPARAARNDSLGYGRLLGGMARATAYDGSFNFGFAVGYGNAVHSRTTPTAWEVKRATTVPGEPVTPPKLPINWTRQSVLFGPEITVRWSGPICDLFRTWVCNRPMRSFDLVARALPLVDVGVVDTSSIDPQLKRFLDGKDGLDLDMSFSLEAGVMIHLSQGLSIDARATMGVLGWDDFALGGRDQHEAQSSITYDAHLVAGGSMGVTWGY